MTALMGNTEARVIYKNFNLQNLHHDQIDNSHYTYQKYLQYNSFVPAGDRTYFAHTQLNKVPVFPSLTANKGLFNLFPLDLAGIGSGGGGGGGSGSSTKTLGIISTSPLKLEIELSPVPTIQWFLMYVFVYLNRIDFTGKQDVVVSYV